MKTPADNVSSMPHEGFVRLCTVLQIIGIKKTTLYSWIRRGIFPPPKKLTKRTSVWPVSEIRDFIKEKSEAGKNEGRRAAS